MFCDSSRNNLNKIIDEFNFKKENDYTLIVIFGLLGDFDSIEYAINLKKFIESNPNNNLDIFALAIGREIGKEKFCDFTGFPKENLKVVSDNKIHNDLLISRGIDIGLGGWINMLLMLSGVNSIKTIKEVIRGYTGDPSAEQIFSEKDQIKILNFIQFSGKHFKKSFGDGYLRPFELATFRLNNMIEIIQNWNDYILNDKFLPQRGATYILNKENQIIYEYLPKDVLGYSSSMSDPLLFLHKIFNK
tara:strand:+ start:80 stop:817 length:738 start_codon:yes stop_codon:yes gene_type:complete